MKKRSWFAKIVLLPCSKIYGAITYMRNKFFDWKIFKEVEFDVPVITVGNIAVGGTGKTPHVEYIITAFKQTHHIAVLSRGYRRDTKGFVMAGRTSTPRDIGDEAYQIYHKFNGEVVVAVCEDRVVGIEELLRIDPKISLIVLDDAFQHRYVKPAISIVVTEYNYPLSEDKMLPYGRLREPARGINRADMVVVTKCPKGLKPFDYRSVLNDYDLFPSQHLFFSHYSYQPLKPVFPEVATFVPYLDWLTPGDSILAVAGIGNPRPFVRHIKSFGAKVKVDVFDDHHQYTKKDIDYLFERYKQLKGSQRSIIITTEKDAVRLAANPYFPFDLKAVTYYLPIEVEFESPMGEPPFENTIAKMLRNYLAQRKQ
ncbi:MAG: tetraacyldisaccharide 4'-kinase [Muribaculaceae bacterium]|nr:tetraacyldisaccharide 4'-kinase [Muribaculaceae bacterium]